MFYTTAKRKLKRRMKVNSKYFKIIGIQKIQFRFFIDFFSSNFNKNQKKRKPLAKISIKFMPFLYLRFEFLMWE